MSRLVLPVGSVLVWLIIDGLTVYRVTRLLTQDTLLEPWRRWITGHEGWLVELLMCRYCISVWVAAATVVLTWQVPHTWIWFAFGGATAGVASLLFERWGR